MLNKMPSSGMSNSATIQYDSRSNVKAKNRFRMPMVPFTATSAKF